ncbi:MAG: tRNA (guanosine(46)-N7)-methyltransferase TrmB [Bacillus subtilis]|nr:tRNA (guanosine(46)-N7)-methyltransferase TrmB [Bacillus subtilis]
MRLRKVPYAEEFLLADQKVMVHEPKQFKGRWSNVFQNKAPIHLEIGTGKGKFLIAMAKLHPNVNFIGVEKYESVLIRALEKCLDEPLPNLRLVCIDALELPEVFAPAEVATLYLNFSDPWPKTKQKKRRLTHSLFLMRYRSFMDKGAVVRFKTDNFPLFMDSMMSFVEYGMAIERISLDLHAATDIFNVETEFETRFVAMGHPIFYLESTFQEA